jgi:predicted HTH transcriptional regulator
LADALNAFFQEITEDSRLTPDPRSLMEAGESSSLEFKAAARFNQHTGSVDSVLEGVISKTIAAFLNTDGGTLLIGVHDSGMPVGIANDLRTLSRKDQDGYEQFLMNLVSKSIGVERCPDVGVSFHHIEDEDICMVRVDPSPRPAYVTEGAERRLYVRAGNTSRPLTTEEAVSYVGEHWR